MKFNHKQRKLSIKRLDDIRKSHKRNGGPYSSAEIARMVGVRERTVNQILNGDGAYTRERIDARRQRDIEQWIRGLE